MDQQADIKSMINTMSAGNYVEAQKSFNDLMMSRATTAINDYKAEFAKSIFKNKDAHSIDTDSGE